MAVAAGARLTATPLKRFDLPPGFRGSIHQGAEATRLASAVSGPFEASPLAYVIPSDQDALASLVRWASDNEVALIPRGAGTGLPGGNLGPEVIVEIGPAFGGIEVFDGDRRLEAGAGEIAEDVDSIARTRGGFLPFLPSSSRWCSVGGMVANNAAGPRSFHYGAICEWVEVIEGFCASGEPFRVGDGLPTPEPFARLLASQRAELPLSPDGTPEAWPAVRKNASGYGLDRFLRTGDPAQLLVGSEGTLALVTKAVLRYAPLPKEHGVGLLRVESSEALQEAALVARELEATACEFFGRRFLEISAPSLDRGLREMSRGAYALVMLEVSGSEEEVRVRLEGLARIAGARSEPPLTTMDPATVNRLWSIRHAASPTIARESERGRISTQFIEDCVVPPNKLARYLDGLDAILKHVGLDAVVFGHAGDGNVHVNPLVPVEEPDWPLRVQHALERVADLVWDLGGTLSGEHGDGRLRAALLSRIWPPELIRAFRSVKKTLDPKGILNPGVILPTPRQDPFAGFRPRPRSYPK